MKSTFTLLIILLLAPLNSFSQRINIFSDPNSLKEFLDKKTYIVPNYGEIRFDFNNKDTKIMSEKRIRDGADDEVVDLIFDVSIKRNQVRKKDKFDYKVEISVNPDNSQLLTNDPNVKFVNSFLLARNIVYPIKDFPSYFSLFADGDLYFMETSWEPISFEVFKSLYTKTTKGARFGSFMPTNAFDEYINTSYIKCRPY
jgi:hypothetical protein